MKFKRPEGEHHPFRVQLEQSITRRMVQQYEDAQAPEWVIHRRIDGREVLNTRTVKGAAWRFRK
ncbi:MAG TPA: hypothetical protein VIG24_01635 [Acidimicrobiia bacterium]